MPVLLIPAAIAAVGGWGIASAVGAWWGGSSLLNRVLAAGVGLLLAFLAVLFVARDQGVLSSKGVLSQLIASVERITLGAFRYVRDVVVGIVAPIGRLLGVA